MPEDDVFAAITRQIAGAAAGLADVAPETVAEFFSDRYAPPGKKTMPEKAIAAGDAPAEFTAAQYADFSALTTAADACVRCRLREGARHVVFGEGDTNAGLMFIGEAPGYDEDRTGRPFVGKAGQLLDKMIAAMKFSRSEIYIANIVKCRPPGNRNPEPAEAEACLPWLRRQIELIEPEVMVLLGAVPSKALLGQNYITKIRGRWFDYMGIAVMPTFHPSYLLRNPAAKREAWADLRQVMARLGKSP